MMTTTNDPTKCGYLAPNVSCGLVMSSILLGFRYFQEEVEYFGKHAIPLLRR
ncbi:hypothetical protein J2R76_003949 [Bradyrhizobium sp. USDA 4532]|uniref:hypothetical protein n=1 Tax=unclassified Bradyrhizobium TaxID=2631580 RepID=UPI0020A1F5B4|nr:MULTISPECIES: hypothetical protein [unclassified Bradyrhizobium]MCP1835609.1 hypothetical protein [Bradyrhizobium sp. USDA 4545]MCP1920358.1 hypothetical protein [Bradyrhizobium sp. USDA 4532]